MSASLVDRIEKARESEVEIGGFKFTVRRPTPAEAEELGKIGIVPFLQRFVIGWNLKEIDLVPGGMPEEVPFDPATFGAWIGDEQAIYRELSEKIIALFLDFRNKKAEAQKN